MEAVQKCLHIEANDTPAENTVPTNSLIPSSQDEDTQSEVSFKLVQKKKRGHNKNPQGLPRRHYTLKQNQSQRRGSN